MKNICGTGRARPIRRSRILNKRCGLCDLNPMRRVCDFRVEEARPARRHLWLGWCAAAAALIITVTLSVRVVRAPTQSPWKVSWNGAKPLGLRNGQVIDTGSHSAARLESEFVGEVQVDAESRLRVVQSNKDEQRFALEHGTIHALIWAPPREFVVDTPSAKTVDLGCQYTLHVGADGTGLLNVETGWVAFQWHDLESFIPAGAACETTPGKGPGVPYFRDSPVALRRAVAQFDASGDFDAVRVILSSARPQDGLTLWHLLTRTEGMQRGVVFDRFSELVKLPASVTRAKILEGDPGAIDAAWNALDLGDTDWWREWKRKW